MQPIVATRATLVAITVLAFSLGAMGGPQDIKVYDRPEYLAIRKQLVRGWGTWDTRDALAQVLLPEGVSVSLSFKHPGGSETFSRPKMVTDKKGSEFRPGMHALDGSYSEAEINWKETRMRVQSATQGDDLVVLVTPVDENAQPTQMVVTSDMLWGKPGTISGEPGRLTATLPDREITAYAVGQSMDITGVPGEPRSLTVNLNGIAGVSTGRPRTISEIQEIVAARRTLLLKEAAGRGELVEAYSAIQSALGWSTIYEPGFSRVVTVVSRDWDQWFGGYVLFGWDNFFLPYACSLFSRDLAYANFAEHMRSMTPDGFIANVDETGGRTSWDRSQPPVASLMLKELYKRFGDRWILEASFDDLLSWNRWWISKRMNGNLLGWGSDAADGPLHEKQAHTAVGAAWESGMDDSPMFEDIPFNPQKNMFELEDAGLNGLYVADCRALAEIADVIGRNVEAAELRLRAEQFSARMETLWSPTAGLYLNRRTDTGEASKRVTPTMFYPLIGRVPTTDRATEMVDQHLMNPTEFGGQYGLPSIARNDPAFPTQHYWKGAVWPPLNFLVYLGLRNYDFPVARRQLAAKSMAMFLGEWKRKGFISENYSALDGTGDDPHLTSTPFYSWGVLMGMMGFIEAGQMPAPETPIGVTGGR